MVELIILSQLSLFSKQNYWLSIFNNSVRSFGYISSNLFKRLSFFISNLFGNEFGSKVS
jgi:hypothetical protein